MCKNVDECDAAQIPEGKSPPFTAWPFQYEALIIQYKKPFMSQIYAVNSLH